MSPPATTTGVVPHTLFAAAKLAKNYRNDPHAFGRAEGPRCQTIVNGRLCALGLWVHLVGMFYELLSNTLSLVGK